jgi:hypothetical protein
MLSPAIIIPDEVGESRPLLPQDCNNLTKVMEFLSTDTNINGSWKQLPLIASSVKQHLVQCIDAKLRNLHDNIYVGDVGSATQMLMGERASGRAGIRLEKVMISLQEKELYCMFIPDEVDQLYAVDDNTRQSRITTLLDLCALGGQQTGRFVTLVCGSWSDTGS